MSTLTPPIVERFSAGKHGVELLRIPPEAHTLAGFRRWVFAANFPEKLKAAYLKGEVSLDMSKEEIQTHAAVKTAIAGRLFTVNEESDFGDLYINGVLVTNRTADVSNNPDAVAVLWKSLRSGKVRYVSHEGRELEIEGSHDWILEIVSDGSVLKDTVQFRKACHEARVSEYWLVDARGKSNDFQILCWRKNGFVAAQTKNGWVRSRVFGRWFRLTRHKDRRGGWKCSLEIKAD
jgi:Uma2 family endonuclease